MPLPTSLFPFSVGTSDIVVRAGEEETLAPLWPGEETSRLKNAVDKRRREFRAGRHVARAALIQLGLEPTSILADDDRVPLFPPGVAGSISHTGRTITYAVAVVSQAVPLLGVDAEELIELDAPLLERIVRPDERGELARCTDERFWGIVVFSCKEAVYKCVFPRIRRMLGFHDVLLGHAGQGVLHATIPSAAELGRIEVRYALSAQRVTSAAFPTLRF